MAAIGDKTIWYDPAQATYWENVVVDSDTDLVEMGSAEDFHGSQVQLVWTRSVASGLTEDVAVIDLAMSVEPIGGAPSARLSAGQMGDAETDLGNFWTNMKPKVSSDWTLKEYVWRHFGMDYPLGKTGLSQYSPIVRRTAVGTTGSGSTTRLPDQVALTCTLKTASRKHWGRIYLGGFTSSQLGAGTKGHCVTADVDVLALNVRSLINDLYANSANTRVGIWSTKYRGFMSIKELTVDDTFDVIRRRRPKWPSYRKTYTS